MNGWLRLWVFLSMLWILGWSVKAVPYILSPVPSPTSRSVLSQLSETRSEAFRKYVSENKIDIDDVRQIELKLLGEGYQSRRLDGVLSVKLIGHEKSIYYDGPWDPMDFNKMRMLLKGAYIEDVDLETTLEGKTYSKLDMRAAIQVSFLREYEGTKRLTIDFPARPRCRHS